MDIGMQGGREGGRKGGVGKFKQCNFILFFHLTQKKMVEEEERNKKDI